jgi:hypothetical protein
MIVTSVDLRVRGGMLMISLRSRRWLTNVSISQR